MHPSRGVSLLLLAMIAASCAGPTKLARQSERELRAGDFIKAYDLARRAVEKDPDHEAARAAMTAAATQRVDDWKARIVDAARGDTVAGAREALELREFRGELARYRIELPPDPGFFQREGAIIEGAAAIEYRKGDESLAARRPKEGYRHFRAAESFVASYRDLQDKLRRARELAMTRVVVLPFANGVGVPRLTRTLSDMIYHAIASRLVREGFEFTELVSPDEVYATMTVSELDALPEDAVWRVANGVEAARIVAGRVYGLRASTNTFSFQYPIYRKVIERDTSGKAITNWVESRFDAVARERVVDVRWDLEVLDARSHAELAKRSEAVESVARVAWTDFRAEGSCGDYCLVPPDRGEDEQGRKVNARWKECFGAWTLPDMLEQARHDRQRSLYHAQYRDEFRSDSRHLPVLCGELPGENDLAALALEDIWRPVLATLKDLDQKD